MTTISPTWTISDVQLTGDTSDLHNRSVVVSLADNDGRSMDVTFYVSLLSDAFIAGYGTPSYSTTPDKADAEYHALLDLISEDDSDKVLRNFIVAVDSASFTAFSADGKYSYVQEDAESVSDSCRSFPLLGNILDSDGNIHDYIDKEVNHSIRLAAIDQVSYIDIWGNDVYDDLIKNGVKYEI